MPSKNEQNELYQLVQTHMIHGPCGIANRSSPCMKDGKCSIFYPKKFQTCTVVDSDGYPIYRRKDTSNTILKSGVILDNYSVVPYNPTLLLRYQAYINIEWCNQSTSIKYLFKYINKGYDRITTVIENKEDVHKNLDEIKHFIYCRSNTN